jgi:uncharacterized protein
MNDSTNLCLSCGHCCEGTVIGFVQLDHEELPVLKELMEIEEASVGGFFLQPCSRYCNGCTIYSQRPKHCASYKCGLLKSFEQNELDFDSAIKIVEEVRIKKIALEEKLGLLPFKLKSESFYFKMVELKQLFQKDNPELSLTQNDLDLRADFKQLESLLLDKFDISLS